MALFSKVFSVYDPATLDASAPKLVPLSRGAANELVLAAVLMPFAVSELNAEYADKIYCSDSSSSKGAFYSAECSRDIIEVLWKSTKSKGAYTRLLSPVEAQLRKLQPQKEQELEEVQVLTPSLKRLYRFSFIEVFAGSAGVTAAVAARGWSVGPPIDLSFSPEYDVSTRYIMSWLSYFIFGAPH